MNSTAPGVESSYRKVRLLLANNTGIFVCVMNIGLYMILGLLLAFRACEPKDKPAVDSGSHAAEPEFVGQRDSETGTGRPGPERAARRERALEAATCRDKLDASDWRRSPACPRISGKPFVLGIGSSTMGYPLGPMLVKELHRWGIGAKRWARASSGLARPDFWDWEEKVRIANRKYDPDVYVVALGGNDNQGLMLLRGKRKRRWQWINLRKELWVETYKSRIDRLLALMSGPDRRRMVIWFTPVGFPGRAMKWSRRAAQLMRERVEAFDGPAHLVDLFRATVDEKGRPIYWFVPPGAKRRVELRHKDLVHLTDLGVRWKMLEPVLEILRRCQKGAVLPTSPSAR